MIVCYVVTLCYGEVSSAGFEGDARAESGASSQRHPNGPSVHRFREAGGFRW